MISCRILKPHRLHAVDSWSEFKIWLAKLRTKWRPRRGRIRPCRWNGAVWDRILALLFVVVLVPLRYRASCLPIALSRMFWFYSASERVIMQCPEYSVPLYPTFPQRMGPGKITKKGEQMEMLRGISVCLHSVYPNSAIPMNDNKWGDGE